MLLFIIKLNKIFVIKIESKHVIFQHDVNNVWRKFRP